MMNEIYKRGPITCAIASSGLHGYDGGIIDDKSGDTELTHAVSVVGWGTDEDNGTPYWFVRNSWGEYWGISGFFKIIRGTNNLGIESDCSYAVPVDTWSQYEEEK